MRFWRSLGLGLAVLGSCGINHPPDPAAPATGGNIIGLTNLDLRGAEAGLSSTSSTSMTPIPVWDKTNCTAPTSSDTYLEMHFNTVFYYNMASLNICGSVPDPENPDTENNESCFESAPSSSTGQEDWRQRNEFDPVILSGSSVSTPFDIDLEKLMQNGRVIVKLIVHDDNDNIGFNSEQNYEKAVYVGSNNNGEFTCLQHIYKDPIFSGSTVDELEFYVNKEPEPGMVVDHPINIVIVTHYKDLHNNEYHLPFIIDPTWRDWG